MWIIYEKKSLLKTIKKIPVHVLKHYELWKKIIELESPQGLRPMKGFYDEALKGKFDGLRSSRLNKAWRVFYMINESESAVYVIDINHHDYRGK